MKRSLSTVVLATLCSGVMAQQRGPVPVVLETVAQSTFVDRVEALGTLQANELVEIGALVTERIDALYFEDGDTVEQGDLLVQFAMDQEQALLAEAQAVREEAASELRRSEALAERGAASATELSLRRREFAVADARARAVQAQIDDRTIRAPFAGTVGIRDISVGASVSPGDIIARLADTSVMKLDFSVPSTFLEELRPGTPIEGRTRAFGGEAFVGEVATVDSVVDPVTRSVLVRALLPNDDGRLRPGLLMTVDLLFNERQSLAVDERALVPNGTRSFVFVVQASGQDGEMIAVQREVQTGVRRGVSVEIVSGLQAGEQVVVEGALRLTPNAPVRPREELRRSGAITQ